MAVGNIVSNVTSMTNASSYLIQAGSGQDWVIHNIYHTNDVGLLWTNSTITGTMSVLAGMNIETNLQFHVTASVFIVLNINSAMIVGYDGVRTA